MFSNLTLKFINGEKVLKRMKICLKDKRVYFFQRHLLFLKKKIKCNLSSCTIQQSFSFDCFPNTSLSNNLLPNTYFLSIEILHGLKIEDLKRLKGGP